MRTIYFDNAATTFIKPSSVYFETDKAMRKYAANSSRGSHSLSLLAGEKIFDCRQTLASMFGASPENVILTFNTTYALNMAIKGVAETGDHFLISNLEHNSVLRPVQKLKDGGIIDCDVFDTYFYGNATPEKIIRELEEKIKPNTKCVICTHTSNICSYSPPIRTIGKFCRERGLIFIVDAAQGAGHRKIDIAENSIDILCMPAHKGLYGPQGVGVMILGDGILPDTIIEGGSGINSLTPRMPDDAPERYEAGTLPCQSIHGLNVGAQYIEEYGYEKIEAHEITLWNRLYRRIKDTVRIKIYDENHAGSIFLFNIVGISSSEVSDILSSKGICVRSGYHCAALAHRALLTDVDCCGGAVRVSFSLDNTPDEVDALARAILDIARHFNI